MKTLIDYIRAEFLFYPHQSLVLCDAGVDENLAALIENTTKHPTPGDARRVIDRCLAFVETTNP